MTAGFSAESEQTGFTVDETAASPSNAHASSGKTQSLLDVIATSSTDRADDDFYSSWIRESDPIKAIAAWIARSPDRTHPRDAAEALRRINRDIGRIDRLLNQQLNEILHHPRLQKLEASWRGLRYLVENVEPGANCKIRIMSLSWEALVRDMDRAIEFDQSKFFKKIYSEEFGTSGGEPFSVLIGDYEMHLRPSAEHRTDDVAALGAISQVAAAAFAPFITSAHPSIFGMESFQELERPVDFERMFNQPEYTAWNSLRKQSDSRFLSLTLPHILLRKPYDGRLRDSAHFPFKETTDASDESDFLWGNAAYGMGAVLLRSFCQNGWLADIRGVRQDREEGGVITGLPEVSWKTDRDKIAVQSPLDVVISGAMEAEFSNLGFSAICPCDITGIPAIHSTPSLQMPERFDDEKAMMSARLSTMLHYILCVSRIAHYIKVLGREKIGSYTEPSDCEEYLNDWLRKYVTQDDDAEPEVKARYPLREAEATIRERPDEPGNFYCTIHLQPHYQMDDMVSAVKLTTELSPLRNN